MKKIAIALTLFILSLSFSACRKINYEEGDKLKKRKFLETINGVWKIEHYYRSIDLNTYSEDSVPIWNARYGGTGTLTINYYENLTLNWGNHKVVSYFDKEDKEAGYKGFYAYYYYTEELRKDTLFGNTIQYLPIYSDVEILKLDQNNLILNDAYAYHHGDRLVLTKSK
jgi:hypothetical protein